jgi:hypothetical protein
LRFHENVRQTVTVAIGHGKKAARNIDAWLRVHPIAFLPMAVLMPVAYLLLTPLGLFTLDSSSWETRGHVPGTTPR